MSQCIKKKKKQFSLSSLFYLLKEYYQFHSKMQLKSFKYKLLSINIYNKLKILDQS